MCIIIITVKRYLVVIGDLHGVDPYVDVEFQHQQLPGLSGVQGAQRTRAVVSQPGERVQAVASVLPLHLHHALLAQSADAPHRVSGPGEGGGA